MWKLSTMFFYVYKTINKLNGKHYIGAHKTSNLDDGYLGSGKLLKAAIRKYGVENFEKEILSFFKDQHEMYAYEAKLVDDKHLVSGRTYNLKLGGSGGFDHLNSGASKSCNPRFRPGWLREVSFYLNLKTPADIERAYAIRKKTLDAIVAKYGSFKEAPGYRSMRAWHENNPEKSAEHFSKINSPDSVKKRKERYKEICHSQKENNSQFGTCWVFNDTQSIKVPKTELADFLKLGWSRGRKMSHCQK